MKYFIIPTCILAMCPIWTIFIGWLYVPVLFIAFAVICNVVEKENNKK